MTSDHVLIDGAVQDLLFRAARTPKTFAAEPVGEDRIAALYDLVKWGPTSFNQQPLRVALVRSSEAMSRLLPLLREGNQARTASAPLTAILAADLDFHEELPEVLPSVPHAREAFADEDLRTESALLNATLQIGYFIIGVRALGLAAGPMTGFDAEKVSQEFFPDGRHRALVVINIGKPGPGAWAERLPRLPYDRIFTSH
ncbi:MULTISPECIES: malonic semialdehyde reductase [Micromonospora]|uniref:Malonic semialdehyde reductase n=1 Tax=Micromonospora tulbaghiae TaxID=479978 RepID=A0A386WNN1_9ACTN|nr:malonic semialdehyde reductase [Micromonospora tulbaghiae]AYF29995.1 malonic semialdehyde reductase [Micromonospora tulbaghiae]